MVDFSKINKARESVVKNIDQKSTIGNNNGKIDTPQEKKLASIWLYDEVEAGRLTQSEGEFIAAEFLDDIDTPSKPEPKATQEASSAAKPAPELKPEEDQVPKPEEPPVDNSKIRTEEHWTNGQYRLMDNGDGVVGHEDLVNNDIYGRITNMANDSYQKLQDFFSQNKGKQWNSELLNKANELVKSFNTLNRNDNHKVVSKYDENDNTLSVIEYDENGNIKDGFENTFDENNRIASQTTFDGNGNSGTTEWTYHSNGKSASSTSNYSNGAKSEAHYDENGYGTEIHYDSSGRITAEVHYGPDGKEIKEYE